MAATTAVRMLVRANGERLPILVDVATGQPLFDPVVYTMNRLRSRAANTVHHHLVAIQLLLRFCTERDIDLAARVRAGPILELHEIDALISMAKTPKNVRAGRPSKKRKAPTLSPEVAANRLRAIRAYLAWLTNRRLHQLAHSDAELARYQAARDRMLAELSARLPSVKMGGEVRSGLSVPQRDVLLRIIDPAAPECPWRRPGPRIRNCIMLRLLYDLGLRRGELLSLRVDDVNVRECRLSIVRRPDDPRDPRRRQPVVKTEERVLELSPDLTRAITDYILQHRRSIGAARSHGLLFVEMQRGSPLSFSGLDKVFLPLRKVRGLPNTLTSHDLRHDWNDRFSHQMDEKKVRPGDEMRWRKYLQGWRSDSSAHRYNRRHTVRRANEALLDMQRTLVSSEKGE